MPSKDRESDSPQRLELSREAKPRHITVPPNLRERAEEIIRAKDDQLVDLVKTRIIESILVDLANPIGPVAAYNESDNKAYGQYGRADDYFETIVDIARKKIAT